jgi:hypothetical protein
MRSAEQATSSTRSMRHFGPYPGQRAFGPRSCSRPTSAMTLTRRLRLLDSSQAPFMEHRRFQMTGSRSLPGATGFGDRHDDDLRLLAFGPFGADASVNPFKAALTATEVRSRTSSSTGRFGVGRGFQLPSSTSVQKTSTSPWAMARLRSVAHLGITRSGQKCIAA